MADMGLDMVADMEVDKVADIEVDIKADMEVDMVADIDIEIDMEMQFGERVGQYPAHLLSFILVSTLYGILFLFVAMLFLFSILNPIIFLLPCQLFS